MPDNNLPALTTVFSGGDIGSDFGGQAVNDVTLKALAKSAGATHWHKIILKDNHGNDFVSSFNFLKDLVPWKEGEAPEGWNNAKSSTQVAQWSVLMGTYIQFKTPRRYESPLINPEIPSPIERI